MKKYAKLFAVIAVAVSVLWLYTYKFFDDEPFDDLKAGEIVSARITDGDGYTDITNLGSLPQVLDDLELERRAYRINPDLQKGKITIELTYADGKVAAVTVDNTYIHTEKGAFLADKKENIAFLRYAFKLSLFGYPVPENCDEAKVNDIVVMAVDGKTGEEIREWAKHSLLSGGLSADMLKSFANQGYSLVYVYALKAEERQRLERQTRYNERKTQYRLLAQQRWDGYKNGSIVYEHPYKRPPADFKFGNLFDDRAQWDAMEFRQNEKGYFYTSIPSADGRYYMTVTIDDNVYENMYGGVVDNRPSIVFVDFYLQSDSVIPADYPAIDVIKSGNALSTANILTEKITGCMDLKTNAEKPDFSKNMFLCILHSVDNPGFCYYNIFPTLQSSFDTQFKTTNMERVVRQVFGDYKWDARKDFFKDSEFNEQTQCYEFSTAFGWGVMSWGAKNISSSFSADGKQVYSDFDLRGPDPAITTDPEYKEYGKYRAVYDIVTEDGETFLRFNRYEKI